MMVLIWRLWCMTGWMGLDIGPEAIKQFEGALKGAKVRV